MHLDKINLYFLFFNSIFILTDIYNKKSAYECAIIPK